MEINFKYALPDELYVEGVSGKLEGTFTYDGPEIFNVLIDELGNVIQIDVSSDYPIESDFIKTINSSEQPEVAYMFAHYFQESDEIILSETVDEVMENGDVYKKPINPDLKDAYVIKYDIENEKWELNQLLKTLQNMDTAAVQGRKNFVETYVATYDFTEEIQSKIIEYLQILQDCLDNPKLICPWKYITLPNPDEAPPIPPEIAAEFTKISQVEV